MKRRFHTGVRALTCALVALALGIGARQALASPAALGAEPRLQCDLLDCENYCNVVKSCDYGWCDGPYCRCYGCPT